MATKFLTINPWLTLRSASASWRETVGWCVHVYVSCVWLDLLFFLCFLPRLGGFFVCLFAYSRHWIWYHIYLGRSRHCLFQILGPTSLYHYGRRDGLYQRDLPSWCLHDKCALRRWVLQLSMFRVEALGETDGPVPSVMVLIWPASLSVWILAILSKLWWLELRKNKATAGRKIWGYLVYEINLMYWEVQACGKEFEPLTAFLIVKDGATGSPDFSCVLFSGSAEPSWTNKHITLKHKGF